MFSSTCFRIKGRMSLYNGTPSLRIWPIGTKRMLGVSEGRFKLKGYDNIPKDSQHQIHWNAEMFGDFLVCPFTDDRPGVMRLICVESAEHISIGMPPPTGMPPFKAKQENAEAINLLGDKAPYVPGGPAVPAR
jgi:hypothetical protein